MSKAGSCSICIFLLILLSINRIFASDYYSNALRIYSECKFFEASIEFERAIFYEKDSNRIPLYKYYKSLCYKELAQYDKALGELKSINLEGMPDSLFLIIHYERVLCSYLYDDLNQALSNITRIYARFTDTLKIFDFLPLNIMCLNSCRQWKNALRIWNYYLDNSNLDDSVKEGYKEEIDRLYETKHIPRFYSSVRAEKLSTFFPGSGQIYSGKVVEGSINMLINIALVYYTINELSNAYYSTGYFVGYKLFYRFYSGGIRRAKSLAVRKNEEEIKAFNSENNSLLSRIHLSAEKIQADKDLINSCNNDEAVSK